MASIEMAYSYPKEVEKAKKEHWPVLIPVGTMETYVYAVLKSLFKAGFTRNIHIFTYHQTEEYLPQALACMKAAKKLTFEYMEDLC